MSSAPVRESLQTLISFTRDLVGEADAETSTLTDNQVQSALDQTRERVRYEQIYPLPSILPGGIVEYREFHAEPHLEADAIILDASFNALTDDDFDLFDSLNGCFVLNSSCSTGLYLLANRHDPYAAAADLLTSMAAREKASIDFSEVGLSIKASQTAPQMTSLAKELRKKARIRSITFGRSDIR